MALLVEPVATEQLNRLRNTLGPLYLDAIWAQRGFEQDVRNGETMASWRASYPAWDRLFGRNDPSVNKPLSNVASMPCHRGKNKVA